MDLGDRASGFRHSEGIRLTSSNVLMYRGGPEFYVASSRPWKESEHLLRGVVADPLVLRNTRSACAWSVLALSVCGGSRQEAQQARLGRWLQEKVEQREAVSWALSAELRRLWQERNEAAVQLRCTQAALQQALGERDMLRGQLLQLERSVRVAPWAHEMVPWPLPGQLGATAWAVGAGEQGTMAAMGAQGMPQSQGQMAAPAAVVYVPGSQSPWAQVMHPPVPVPVPQPFPFHVPFPVGFPDATSLPSSAVMEGAAAAAATTIAAVTPESCAPGTYPPGLWAAVGAQEEMALVYAQNCCGQEEYSENLQGEYSLEDSGSHRQEEDPVGPQGMPSLGDSRSCSQEADPARPQETAPLGDSRSHSQDERPVLRQEEHPLGKGKSHTQEGGPENSQGTSPPGGSRSRDVRKSPKNQQPQEKKAKRPKGKKASDSQRRGKPDSCSSPKNWDCPWCKGSNFPWRKACYKCKKVCMAVESEGPDPGQTH
ncbi:hypothetical protein E2I00_019096 [Balaenoptera physalus]|uniref:RanBP2-type domain-containing protein n=1 Tax=Balaenoptera physalus TaxID=9770 RepID=A0A643AU26_BALPH|nr:hypothetical protein E2I00_003859 [Balaenoptera physalus]KAB0341030.1 hypothetical protein E2I00_019096 [Balaenoptera physalus]